MPGMNYGSPALVAAFRADLLAEGTVAFLIFVLLAIAWVACRETLLARAGTWLSAQYARRQPEPAWRRVLRIGFGVLWILDGLLQAQPAMPAGLPAGVIKPAAAGSPGWVLHVVSWGTQVWSAHPVQAAASAVWIQLGIGIWLVSVSTPRWSRLAGLASLSWGLVVWVFGEAFGSILAPDASWLTGAPGAALFYCAAGALLALPDRSWHDPRLGRRLLRSAGLLLIAFAVVQAWPGSGYWQGTLVGPDGARLPGDLPTDISSMAAASQPAPLRDLLHRFAALVAAHGFAVNLVVVIVLAVAGASLLTGRAVIVRPAAGAVIGFCLADWVLVQDLGVLGGLGTDPNSMVPQAIILTAGLLLISEVPVSVPSPAAVASLAAVASPAPIASPAAACAEQPATAGDAGPALKRAGRWPAYAVRRAGVAFGAASASTVLTLWAAAMVVMGAGPMAMAAVHHDPAPTSPGPAAARSV
jgi:hypothetical protein